MHKPILAAASTAVHALTSPAAAQSGQERLDARYDRALAAGYKALFLCGAIANAERTGTNRPVSSVMEWEFSGVYSKIDPIVRTLEHRIVRSKLGPISHVEVDWAEDMQPRCAKASFLRGCRLAPIAQEPGPAETDLAQLPGFLGSGEAAFLAPLPRLDDGAIHFPPLLSPRSISTQDREMFTSVTQRGVIHLFI